MKNYWIVLVGAALVACEPQPKLDDLTKDMVVQTAYDTSIDFTEYQTYSMSLDTIGLVSNASNATAIVNPYATTVTTTVKKNLDGCGWQRVEPDQSPDLGVNVYIVNDVSVYQSVNYPSYYYGYPGYSYGGYYGYYNYPYVSTYSSSRAVMVIELADLKLLDAQTKKPTVIWIANMGDLINSPNPEMKVVEAINQAFEQSNYLKQ